MTLNISEFLTTFKKQAYISLVQNMGINFPNIKNKILQYATSQESDVDSVLDLFSLDLTSITSSSVNATIQLLYLDFYAKYTILYSIYNNYSGLLDTSKNKYMYLNNLYKDMELILNTKELSKTNKHVSYVDFSNKNSVKPYRLDITPRSGAQVKQLSFNGILSLPIKRSEPIYPSSIIPISKDVTESFSLVTKGKDYIYFDLLRTQNDYVSIVKSIEQSGRYVSADTRFNISGSVTDIAIDNIYIRASEVNENSIGLSFSSDGIEWSSTNYTYNGQLIPILIEGDIVTGLMIKTEFTNTIKMNDSWIIRLAKIQIPYPSTLFKIKFDKFDKISLLTLDDSSPYKLDLSSVKIRKHRYDETSDMMDYTKINDKVLIFQNSQLDECNITFIQDDSDIYNNKGSINHKYSFYLNNINALSNEYSEHGSLSFNILDVKDINNILIHSSEAQSSDRLYIEYNTYIESGVDKILVPQLTHDQSMIYEYVTPIQTNEDGVFKYNIRFPVDTTQTISLINAKTNDELEVLENGNDPYLYYEINDNNFITIIMKNVYDGTAQYAVHYTPKIWNSSDTYDSTDNSKWITVNKIKYMYYRGSDLKIRMAIKSINDTGEVSSFTGTISSFIEFRSSDEKFKSPYITNYVLMCN